MANKYGIEGKNLSDTMMYQISDVKSAQLLLSSFPISKCGENIGISTVMWSEAHSLCGMNMMTNDSQSLNSYYIGNGPDEDEDDDDFDDDDDDDDDDLDDEDEDEDDLDEDDDDFEEDEDDD